MKIESKQDWWRGIEVWQEDLLKIIIKFSGVDSAMKFQKGMREKKWEDVHSVLEEAWAKAPDSPQLFKIRGWDELCDLCSEAWVFNESKE